MVKQLTIVACLALSACGGDDSGGDADETVTEQEPNDERDEATQLPAGGGEIVIHGSCADASDLDYYDAHPASGGAYRATLTWSAGDFALAIDPEDGFSGSLTESAASPVVVSGQVSFGSDAPQIAVDCYNENHSAGLTNLAYTLELSLP